MIQSSYLPRLLVQPRHLQLDLGQLAPEARVDGGGEGDKLQGLHGGVRGGTGQ